MTTLIDNFGSAHQFLGNDGPIFYFKTTFEAPRGRVIANDTRNPEPEHWQEVVPQGESTIEAVSWVGDRFIVSYLKYAHSEVRVFHTSGEPAGKIDLPGIGSTWGFYGKRAQSETFYAYSSFASPTTIYRYDIQSGESSVFRAPKIDFDPTAYETQQVFAESKDGTPVPIFITYKKGLERNGANPTYLYGYGGFNISITPWFSVENLVWMEMGGIYAVATLRGGGEYGEEWHDAGRLLKKQNVFDDFAAVAEWLIDNRYTSTTKLAIGGRSNGGLLVGASITQRPELFGAGLAAVGVMDMLRFQRFTIGWAWVDDYGSSDDPEQFEALHAYSPLHNVEPGTHYPPLLLTTADHDDRVVPAHSFKFAAEMQAAQAGPAPVLIRIETRAGHGSGKPTAKIIEEASDRWAFLVRVLGMKIH
jgi:prolyl oligopeptidase